jgi:hypothetical protein
MSIPFIVPKKSGTEHREPLKMKNCSFPGCKVKQKMTGKAVYCTEHRKRKYRKIIDANKIADKKAEHEARNTNQLLKHKYTESTILRMKCAIDGCNNEFEIKVYPNLFVFPKYCPDHRNPYRRELFLKQKQLNEITTN